MAGFFEGGEVERPGRGARPSGQSRDRSLRVPPAPEITDFTNTKEVLAIDGLAAGGCIGLDAAGMTWDCYIGQDAVDHEIISQDFLGEPVPGPGHG